MKIFGNFKAVLNKGEDQRKKVSGDDNTNLLDKAWERGEGIILTLKPLSAKVLKPMSTRIRPQSSRLKDSSGKEECVNGFVCGLKGDVEEDSAVEVGALVNLEVTIASGIEQGGNANHD